ncbi:DUF1318 domain-containing protein [Hellea balneolensis]|uniref:DUF1318 domain-containing protein n=1 Tax=Hellea balneolensis TaxID=287478 RepID=UPI00040999AB|nr:DUF1318 domain-containing protein [Hellea balneolensis]
MTLKKTFFTAISAFALLAGGTMVISTLGGTEATAQAQSAKAIADNAKTKGIIGETVAGYLAETGNGALSAAERAAMNEINIGRKSIYTKKARAENLQVEVVAAIFGEKQIAKAASGEKVMDSSGAWRTK